MTPREILQKIQHWRIRLYQPTTGREMYFLIQPPLQFSRISRTVKNRYDRADAIFDCEINAIRLEAFQPNSTRSAMHSFEQFRMRLRTVNGFQSFRGEFLTQAWGLSFIPDNSLKKFDFCLWLKKRIEMHYQPKRSRISALTCSKGIPRRGFFSNSARRRSNSAICSGVKSGSNPSLRRSSFNFCANSIRSASGRVLAALNNSVALMLGNLPAVHLFASA